MKLLDNIKDFFIPSEDDDYDEAEDIREEYERPEPAVREQREQNPSYESHESSYTSTSYEPNYNEEKRSNVVNIQATTQLQVVLVKPEQFSDAKAIADHLIKKETVVLNLETASADNKRRIIDFLVGVAYANGGSLKPVANLTYIITPYNVNFSGEEIADELESNGINV